PLILVIDLGDGNREPVAQAVDDRPDRGALRLERSTLGNVEIETGCGRVHGCSLARPANGPVSDDGARRGCCQGSVSRPRAHATHAPTPASRVPRSHPGDFALLERLDDVARLQVGVVLEADTALE